MSRSKGPRLVAQVAGMIALVACDTFGPPPDEGACGRNGAPCATTVRPATATTLPATTTARVPPVAGISVAGSGSRPSVTAPVGTAGRTAATPTGSAGRVAEWTDTDAGVQQSFASLDLSARHIVADSKRGRIYATVAGNAKTYANSLVSIDGQTAKVVRDIPIGSEPSTLALSDDGSTLWISISGAAALRRVDIAGDELTAAEPIPLPTTCFDKPCVAGPLIVLPGTKDRVLAVVQEPGSGNSSSGVMLLVNGQPQANSLMMNELFGISALTGGPPGYAYGYNGTSSGFDLFAIGISDTGELAVSRHPGLASGYYIDISYRENLVFASSGDVVDVKTPASPLRAGRFATPGAILPLPGNAQALTVSVSTDPGGSNTGIPVTLSVMNVQNFTLIKSTLVGKFAPESFTQPRDLVQAGTTLAFLISRASEPSILYLLQDIAELAP